MSAYAGQTVTLRLQVEPGPKNNSSFDYSFFGNAVLSVGEGRENRADLLQRLTRTRAYRALENANATVLCNTPAQGVAPSNLLKGRNSIASAGSAWRFSYAGDDCRVVYTYEPKTGTLDDFTAQVDNGRPFQPARGGGATVALKAGGKERLVPARGGRLVSARLQDNSLEVTWDYELEGQRFRMLWSFGIAGKALLVSARSEEPIVASFSLGDVVAPLRRTIPVPYLVGHLNYLPAQNVFACRYLDWTASHSSQCPQGAATYETEDRRHPQSARRKRLRRRVAERRRGAAQHPASPVAVPVHAGPADHARHLGPSPGHLRRATPRTCCAT